MDTADVLDRIRALKTRAKNRRDDGRFSAARHYLTQAEELAEQGRANAGRDRRADGTVTVFAAELADVYGMLGGVTRREGLGSADPDERRRLLAESVAHYEAGFEIEDAAHVTSSYNLVNRIVAQLLLDPAALDEPTSAPAEPDAVSAKLRDAHERISERIASDRRDPWMLADRALLEILMSDKTDAAQTYSDLHAAAPPAYVYQSAVETLRPLAAAVGDRRPALHDAVADLERRRYRPAR